MTIRATPKVDQEREARELRELVQGKQEVEANELRATTTEFPRLTSRREALEKIRDLAKPGQELRLADAIDILCAIWNTASNALNVNNLR